MSDKWKEDAFRPIHCPVQNKNCHEPGCLAHGCARRATHAFGPLSQNIKVDDESDIATVYGVRIAGDLLRNLGVPTPPGIWFRVISVKDGVATLEQRRD